MQAEGLSEERFHHLSLLLNHRRMMLAAAEDDFAIVEDLSNMLLREMGESKPYITCTLYGQMLRAQREQFKYAQLEKLEAKARAVLDKSGYKFAFVALQAIVGPTLFSMGRSDAAVRALQHGIDQAVSFAGTGSGLAALPALPLAELAYERNDLDTAAQLVKDYLPVAREFGFIDELMSGYLVAPKLHFARGEMGAAFRALDDAKSVALELGLDELAQLEVRELKQADGLLQLGCHHQLLALPQLELCG